MAIADGMIKLYLPDGGVALTQSKWIYNFTVKNWTEQLADNAADTKSITFLVNLNPYKIHLCILQLSIFYLVFEVLSV